MKKLIMHQVDANNVAIYGRHPSQWGSTWVWL